MKWPGPLIEARLLKRYKRFLADFELSDGTVVTGHCANTGSMKTCLGDHAPCWITHHDDPKRKLKYSWQAIKLDDGWVGINTALANHLVGEAITAGRIEQLSGYEHLRPEQKYGTNSRIDLLLKSDNRLPCYVEVKNVTLYLGDGVVAFPDAVTQRGTKHLMELTEIARSGSGRAVMFFCVQRTSAERVVPAEAFDPAYTAALREAAAAGVEIYAWKAAMDPQGVRLEQALPVDLHYQG